MSPYDPIPQSTFEDEVRGRLSELEKQLAQIRHHVGYAMFFAGIAVLFAIMKK